MFNFAVDLEKKGDKIMATKIKLNNGLDYEHLCNVKLTKEKFPKVYEAKLNELVSVGMSKEDAENWLNDAVFELELYYSIGYGMFAVEAEAIDGGATIYDPYTGEECEDFEWLI